MTTRTPIVGLMPAAGEAKRIAPLPCSKEIYPVGFRSAEEKPVFPPRVACQDLLESMRAAEVERVYVIIRDGKWDIPSFLTDGSMLNMHLAYLMLGLPYGVPYTLDQAYPFIRDSRAVFGFPDILFEPRDAFVHLLRRQEETRADLVLGLFPASNPETMDVVDVGEDGQVRDIEIKPGTSELTLTWILAAWTPAFGGFMHELVSRNTPSQRKIYADDPTAEHRELYMSHVVLEALATGMEVQSVSFPQGQCVDIGTSRGMSQLCAGVFDSPHQSD